MANNNQPVVRMSSVTKRFLDVTANKDVSFSLYSGEICALLGENGAGKTTLMNILFGYYTCDEGEIFIKGKKADLSSPKDAISRGVGMIHQHFALVPSQTVLENIIVGADSSIFLNLKSARRELLGLQERFGLKIDPDTRVWTLSVGEQQKVEILKALYRDVDILIMDEPTAVLAPAEIAELFNTLRSLVKEGRSVVFISHKLNEVMDISDRIVVLRSGQVVAERQTALTNARELANLMVGRELLETIEKKELPAAEPVLRVKSLSALNDKKLAALKSVDLIVRQNEILGMAGISGNGQKELSEVLFGIRSPTDGFIQINGGNLQKVMLARELAGEPSLIIASQPTRGLDVGAMEYIHQRLLQERERGAGILLISEDLDEILALSDRIVVLFEGKIMGEAPGATASREQIGLWMSGVKA